MTPYNPLSPVGRCIYCGGTDLLQDEHVIPESLGGRLVLPESSCPTCAKVTGRFERIVAREMYWGLRLRLGIAGKRSRKKQRPTHWPVQLIDGDKVENLQIKVGEAPRLYVAVEMPPAGIILGEPPRDTSPELKLLLKGNRDDLERLGKQFDAGRWEAGFRWDWVAFNQLLAKVAHALTVGVCGSNGLNFLLIPIILGKAAHFPYLIGGVSGAAEALSAGVDLALGIRDIRGAPHVAVKMSFFGGRLPTYEVVSAIVTTPALVAGNFRSAAGEGDD